MKFFQRVGFVIFAAIAAVFCSPSLAQEQCQLTPMAFLKAINDPSGRIYVPGKIGGQTYYLAIDTGGFLNMLNSSIVARHQLKMRPFKNINLRDGAGNKMPHFVKVPDFNLNATNLPNEQFTVSHGSIASVRFPNGTVIEAGGTLGQLFLSNFDFEIDPANEKVNIFKHKSCDGAPVYWSREWLEIPFTVKNLLPYANVRINGKLVKAVIDTGASVSVVDTSEAKDLAGLDFEKDVSASTNYSQLPSGEKLMMVAHQFQSLEIGGVTFQNPIMQVADLKIFHGAKAIIGMDRLKQMRFYVASKEKMIYATPANATLPAMAGN